MLGDREMIENEYYTEDPQILGANVRNVVGKATWITGSVHS